LGTLVGAVFFLVGDLLLLPERMEATKDPTAEPEDDQTGRRRGAPERRDRAPALGPAVTCRSAANCLGSRPVLLLQADPVN
jgi:hypothetical protein